MRFKQLLICFFIGYLVLLLNLGASLHRAHIFGLHSHGSDTGQCHHSTCCHGHAHSPPVDSKTSQSFNSDHDCAFCKFFDQYQVTVKVFDHREASAVAQLLPLQKPIGVFATLLIATARGPPAIA